MSVSNVNYLLIDDQHHVLRVGIDLVGLLNDQLNTVEDIQVFKYLPATGTQTVPFGAGGGGGNHEMVTAQVLANVTINQQQFQMLRYDLPDNLPKEGG